MDQEIRGEVRALYNRIQWILDDRDLKWTDLAKLIDTVIDEIAVRESKLHNGQEDREGAGYIAR